MLVLEKLRQYAGASRVALVNREKRLTHRQLEERSGAFAAWLLDHLGEDRSPVVIYGEKETDFLCCMLGALKSGRAYVPIDRSVPRERAAMILEAVQPRVAVDFGGLGAQGSALVLDAVSLEEILSAPARPIPSDCWVQGQDTAYLLFTSGSTGAPKGVVVTAANLEAFCRGVLPWYAGQEGGVVLNQVSYSFDVSGCAVYAGLSCGMTLFCVDKQMTREFRELFQALGDSGLTLWVSTPSFAELCAQSRQFDAALLPGVRQFLFCGEVLTHTLCEELAARFPGARVVNTYGPTEATVLVTAVEVTEAMRRSERSIPIGAPIAGVQLRLEGEEGGAGELVILGPSVGPGYFGRPDLTARSFFTDPATGLRGYRTGDLCFEREDLYYYQGRADNQLKLDGFRVEVEDVEANLQKLPNVSRAAVVPVWSGGKVQYLAAFLLLKEPDGLSSLKRAIQLKKQAAAYLPDYMIPRKLFAVESFPFNVNGKVDKKALARRLEVEGR